MALIWLVIYRLFTCVLLGSMLLLYPLLLKFKPKLAKWFSLRFWPNPVNFQPRVWFHAVSVGEANIALALLDALPNKKDVLLTTVTQTGYKLLCDKLGREQVRYLPWDLKYCYRRLFGAYKVPDLLVVETEIWPNLFPFVKEQGARSIIVNGRLSSKTVRFRRNALLRKTLSATTKVLARDDADRARFLAFGLTDDQVSTTGNIKFDFKPKILQEGHFKSWVESDGPLLIFASLSNDEAPILAPVVDALLKKHPKWRVLWAPRHLDQVQSHLDALASQKPMQRSSYSGQSGRLMVLDSIGELSACYVHGSLSVIGGTFNARGGQNFLESLQAGTPALLGPSYENFRREVDEALERGAVKSVAEPGALQVLIEELVSGQKELSQMSKNARDFLASHTGAVDRTLVELVNLGVISQARSEEP